MKVLIACGGSGGHIFPGLSLANELKRRMKNLQLLFIITNKLQDINMLRKVNYNFKMVLIDPMPDSFSLNYLKFLSKLVQAFLKSFLILREYRPDVTVGFGGYVSGPILLLASLMKIPTVLHEQNLVPGRTNKILAGFVDTIAVSFEESKKIFKNQTTNIFFLTIYNLWLKKRSVVVTGNPVRSDFVEIDRQEVLKKFNFTEDGFIILVMGGSQGAHKINQVFINTLAQMEDRDRYKLQIIHLTGNRDEKFVKTEYENLKVKHRVFSFLEEMNYGYRAADLVIARSGATTISEITTCSLPSILIPYPYAAGHQMENALVLYKANSAILLEESKLSPSCLRDHILNLMKDKEKLRNMAENAQKLSKPNAAEKLANEVISLLTG